MQKLESNFLPGNCGAGCLPRKTSATPKGGSRFAGQPPAGAVAGQKLISVHSGGFCLTVQTVYPYICYIYKENFNG